ncbi:MAG: FHA domain-containing protein [Planctomycetota bacterium]
MDLKVTVHCDVDGKPRAYDLEFKQDLVTIGRHSQNDVQIPDMQVSAEHARIVDEDGAPCLIDLGSPLGTLMNGERVAPNRKLPIPDGAELTIGEYHVVVAKPRLKLDDTSTEKTAMVAMKMVKEVLGTLTGDDEPPPYLEVLNDDDEGARLDLTDDDAEYRIGREQDCDLILSHWSISRKHAMVRRKGNDATLLDLGSKNGVLKNAERLDKRASKPLKDGDIIAVGHTEIRYRNPSENLLDNLDDSPTPINDLKDLGLDLGVTKTGPVAPPAKKTPPPPPKKAPPPPKKKAPPKSPPPRQPAARTPPPAAGTPPARRPKKQEASLADYLPLILGGVLLLGALVAAVFLFVLNE